MEAINNLTRIVTSKSNEKTSEFGRTHHISSMVPLPMNEYTGMPEHNLTGLRLGRFEVKGLYIDTVRKKKGRGMKWVVRCRCGRYEVMTHRGINHVVKYNEHVKMKCKECRKTEILSKQKTL